MALVDELAQRTNTLVRLAGRHAPGFSRQLTAMIGSTSACAARATHSCATAATRALRMSGCRTLTSLRPASTNARDSPASDTMFCNCVRPP